MNVLDYVILAVLAVLFVLCARFAFRRRKRPCGGAMDCSRCPYRANCSARRQAKKSNNK